MPRDIAVSRAYRPRPDRSPKPPAWLAYTVDNARELSVLAMLIVSALGVFYLIVSTVLVALTVAGVL